MLSSVKQRFILTHVLMVFIPICLMGVFITVFVHNEIENRIYQKHEAVLDLIKVQGIDKHTKTMENTLRVLSREKELWRIFEDEQIRKRVLQKWELVRKMQPKRAWIYYGSKDNRITVSPEWESPPGYDLRERPWYITAKEAGELTWVKPYAEAGTGVAVFSASIPIHNKKGEFTGVLSIDTFMEAFFKELRTETMGKELELLVVSETNEVITLNTNNDKIKIAKGEYNWDTLFQSSGGSGYINLNNKSYYAAFQSLDPLPLHLVSIVPEGAIIAQIQPILLIIIIMILLGISLSAAGSFIIARYVLKNISSLNSYMHRITNGNLVTKNCVSGNDEFMSLNSYMNLMVQALKEQIEKQRQTNMELEEVITQKEELIHLRTSLIRIFGHNAITPITYLLHTSNDLLEKDKNNEQYRTINTAAWDLKWLSENVMTYLKINEGFSKLRMETISISETTEMLSNIYSPLASYKELDFELSIPDNYETRGNYFLIRIVLENLIDNAIKYSSFNGTIQIKVSQKDNSIIWEIIDSGPGFSLEDREFLFQKFKPLSARPTGGETSTGLGLYIVYEIINHLGGNIALLDSEPGKGAHFSVVFKALRMDNTSHPDASHS